MKEILTVLYDASATLQDVHHDLSTGNASLEDDFVVGEVKYAIEQLNKVLVAANGSGEPVKCEKETLGEYIQRVTESFEFAHETIKDMWAKSFEEAIKILENRRGRAGCIIPTVDGMITGELNLNSSRITFVVGEEEFVYEKYEDNVREDTEENKDYEEEERWEEAESPCDSCNCVAFCQDEMTLLEYVKEREDHAGDTTHTNLKLIEDHLDARLAFDADDYELIRHYLKHNPNTSVHEVDALSDRGLFLAWRAHQYLLGKIK